MSTFANMEAYLTGANVGIPVRQGPDIPSDIVGPMIVLTPSASPGLVTEDLFDIVGWQIRTIGDQADYGSAESLAWAFDRWILRQPWPTWAIRVIRSGGRPVPLLQDTARRWHFTASYLFEVASGLETSDGG